MPHCTSTQVSVLQKAVHPEPATCITVPQQTFLSNKTNFTKNQQPVSGPTCARASVQKEAIHQEPPKRVCTYLCTSVCPTISSSARTTKACLYLPVHERLSNKRQFTKNHPSVSGPTCARTSVKQEAVQQEPPKRVWTYLCTNVCLTKAVHPEPPKRVCTYLCTSVCPTRGSSARTIKACLNLPAHERLSNKRQSPTKNSNECHDIST